jgi:UDP-glucose 4-epimerase
MSVYGMNTGIITKETPEAPKNAYGKSKSEADVLIRNMEGDDFKFTCLRPPMVYGKGCKGNYGRLRKLALNCPIFPDISNQRSMIYIENLCFFIKECIDEEKNGIFFPQNAEYVCTKDMAERIAILHDKKIRFTKIFNGVLRLLSFGPIQKMFGSLIYEKVDTVSEFGFEESVRLTEERGT